MSEQTDNPIRDAIAEAIADNQVILFMKGTPDAPARRARSIAGMAATTQRFRAVRWDGARLAVLDQALLPGRERWLELEGAADTAAAIRRLAVRGAPLIGIVAAYGLALEVAREPTLDALQRGAAALR